jgi:hypothetical protein
MGQGRYWQSDDKIRYAIASDPEISARKYQLHLTFSCVPALDLSSS